MLLVDAAANASLRAQTGEAARGRQAGAPRLTKLPPMADYQFFDRARLEALVRQYGTERNWALIAEGIRGRTGKQCRERYVHHLAPGLQVS